MVAGLLGAAVKPLHSVLWTQEDSAIEWRNTLRHGRQAQFGFQGTYPSDRRDADLMLFAMRVPAWISGRPDYSVAERSTRAWWGWTVNPLAEPHNITPAHKGE